MCHVACCNMMNDVLDEVKCHIACCIMINDVLGEVYVSCCMLYVEYD